MIESGFCPEMINLISNRNRRARWSKSREKGEWCAAGIVGSGYLVVGQDHSSIIVSRLRRRVENFINELHA